MTTPEQLREIASRAFTDADFAAKLQADPQGTLEAEGITLSEEDKAALSQILAEASTAPGRDSKLRVAP